MWLDTSAPLTLMGEGSDLGSEAGSVPLIGELGIRPTLGVLVDTRLVLARQELRIRLAYFTESV